MSGPDHDEVLATAARAVRELMDRTVGAPVDEEARSLRMGLEELTALWEDLKEQSDRLAEERQRYLAFFLDAPEPCLLTDAHGVIREANRAATELFGVAAHLLVGRPLATLVSPGRRREFRTRLAAVVAGAPDRFVSCLRSHAGKERQVVMAARAMSGPRGVCWLLHPAPEASD